MIAPVLARSTFVLAAVFVAACGGASSKTQSQTGALKTTGHAPFYRVGQYCTHKYETRYRAHGFTCARHHLTKL